MYYLVEIFVYHSLVLYSEPRSRCVFTTRQLGHFFSFSTSIYLLGPSQLKKQNHTSRPLCHHLVSQTLAGNMHFIHPEWSVMQETDSRSLIDCPPLHSVRIIKHCLAGWLAVRRLQQHAGGPGRRSQCQVLGDTSTCLHPLKAFHIGRETEERPSLPTHRYINLRMWY